MLVLEEKKDQTQLKIITASPKDAQQVAQLYQKVYGKEYPCPKLFTEEGMREFLTFERSHTITSIVFLEGDVVAAGTFQIHGRVAYSRGWMVDPAWQGKIGTRQVFQKVLLQARRDLKGMVDFFYGEIRTATAKLQAIIDEIGWRPLAVLPRKDIFEGKRETEFIYTWYYQTPHVGTLRLTPRAASIASAVLCHHVRAVRAFVLEEYHFDKLEISYINGKFGEKTLKMHLQNGTNLEADIYPAARNAEKIIIISSSPGEYHSLVRAFLTEIRSQGIEYAEIYVPADATARQAILEDLGFAPTGFLPQWYAPGSHQPADCVIYTIHFLSDLPDRPVAVTPLGAYLQQFITPATIDSAEMSPESELNERYGSLAQIS